VVHPGSSNVMLPGTKVFSVPLNPDLMHVPAEHDLSVGDKVVQIPKVKSAVDEWSWDSEESEADKFVGRRIKVYWPTHGWYEGKVVAVSDNPLEGTHEVLYDNTISTRIISLSENVESCVCISLQIGNSSYY